MPDIPPPHLQRGPLERSAKNETGEMSGVRRWSARYRETLGRWLERAVGRIADARFLARARRPHTAAIGSALALNILFVLVVFWALSPPHRRDPDEIRLTLVPVAHNETVAPPPPVPELTIPVVPMPDIVIQTDTASTALDAISPSEVMAPRPDPSHPNPTPKAGDVASAGGTVILKILVLTDGTVADASIVQTCGRRDADLAAMAYVKEKWKFLPARARDAVIQYWTTVAVHLS
jgi:TonB family protein